jgi:hypothetical protein
MSSRITVNGSAGEDEPHDFGAGPVGALLGFGEIEFPTAPGL